MNRKKKIFDTLIYSVCLIAAGVGIGTYIELQRSQKVIQEIIEIEESDYWTTTTYYLSLAYALRKDENVKALDAIEKSIEWNIKRMLGKDSGLNDYEISTLRKVSVYKNKYCNEACFIEVSEALDDYRVSQ